MTATTETTTGVGRVARVTGPVIDVEFPAEAMPELYNALTVNVDLGDNIEGESRLRTLTLAGLVAQHHQPLVQLTRIIAGLLQARHVQAPLLQRPLGLDQGLHQVLDPLVPLVIHLLHGPRSNAKMPIFVPGRKPICAPSP